MNLLSRIAYQQTEITPEDFHEVQEDEFLPSVSSWVILGGSFLILIFVAAIALAAFFKFKVTVKAAATIRPVGELRLVQAAIGGRVKRIQVEDNQTIHKGQVIAAIDDAGLQTQKSQLQGDIQQKKLQLAQIKAQIQTLEAQMLAESGLMRRMIAAAQEELRNRLRTYQDQQATSQADLLEATAALELAQEELSRYKQLAGTGVIPEGKIREKQVAVTVAKARLERAKVSLDPTDAPVAIAREQIAEAQARGQSVLATLRQQKEQLQRNQSELQSHLQRAQKDLHQVELDLRQTLIRSPTTGTVLQLQLRNPEQVVKPGEAIAYIAPQNIPLLIKARVDAQDIDKVKPGQRVQMQVSACPYPDYGMLDGIVKTVAPDVSAPANSNLATARSAYEITIQPQSPFVGRAEHQCRLKAGMEGRAEIITREQTVLKFILVKSRLLTDL